MLIDYAGERGIGVLVENFGWMQGDPDAIPNFIAAPKPLGHFGRYVVTNRVPSSTFYRRPQNMSDVRPMGSIMQLTPLLCEL